MKPRADSGPTPFLQLLPNLVTLGGMCLGLTSVRFAMAGRFEMALGLIIIAALLDGVDGLLARRLNAASEFGAELDSLADFFNFGVVPGLILYRYALGEANALGWVFVLIYTVCACLRLARFNVNRDTPEGSAKKFFTGVPAPAGAMLALMPAFLTQAEILDARAAPMLVALWMGVVGGLMISRIPTLSAKALRIPSAGVLPLLVGIPVLMGMIFTRVWLLLSVLDLMYLAMVIWSARKLRQPKEADV